jgi:hypothetical protein
MLEFKIEKAAIETNPHFPDPDSFRIFLCVKNLGKNEIFYFFIFDDYFSLPLYGFTDLIEINIRIRNIFFKI